MKAPVVKQDLENAVDVLRRGGIILYPTDTIWGLGCDATNPAAVDKIFRLKGRADSKAMISLIDSLPSLGEWIEMVPKEAKKAIDKTESPLTIIYDTPRGLAPNLTAHDGSAAFRIPRLEYTASLCRLLGRPVVSTSANISGKPFPRNFQEIDPAITEEVDYVCIYGRDREGSPSRILKISNSGCVTVIR